MLSAVLRVLLLAAFPSSQALSSVEGVTVEHFSIRGDGATTVSMSSISEEAFVARATSVAGYSGTVFVAKASALPNSSFYLIKVLLWWCMF
jgi:hypothetical protein